eukprot:1829106-Heterocapsa_arctica.AAC.1
MLTCADYFKATVGLPRIPPWADHLTSVPSDETTGPPCAIEYSRVLLLEWQFEVYFWNNPGVNSNSNHLLEWIERIPCDPTEYYPRENPPLKEAITEDLLITLRERFCHRTIHIALHLPVMTTL